MRKLINKTQVSKSFQERGIVQSSQMYLNRKKRRHFLYHICLKRYKQPIFIHEELGKNYLGGVVGLEARMLRTRSRWWLSNIVNELISTQLITLN